MFDKVKQGKQLLELRSQAKQMQRELADVTNSQKRGDYSVKVSADQKVIYIKKGDERLEDLEKAINEAFK
jgi:DNA-binding protein YbaB